MGTTSVMFQRQAENLLGMWFKNKQCVCRVMRLTLQNAVSLFTWSKQGCLLRDAGCCCLQRWNTMQHARHRKESDINRYHSSASFTHVLAAMIWLNDADLALIEAQLIPIPSHFRLSSSASCSGVSMVCCSCFSDKHSDIQLAMEVKLLWLCTVVTSVASYKENLHNNWCPYFLHLYTLSVCLALTFLHSLA